MPELPDVYALVGGPLVVSVGLKGSHQQISHCHEGLVSLNLLPVIGLSFEPTTSWLASFRFELGWQGQG